MNYGYLLKQTWKNVWKNKILITFGLIGSSGGLLYLLFSFKTSYDLISNPVNTIESLEYANGNQNLIIYYLVLGFNFFLYTITRVGQIRGTFLIEQFKKPLKFKLLFQEVKYYFLRFFFLSSIFTLFFYISNNLLNSGILNSSIEGFETLSIILCGFYCVLIPVSWILGNVIPLALISLIDKDLTIPQAFKNGWQLFKKNIGVLFVFNIVALLLGIIAGVIIFIPIVILISISGILTPPTTPFVFFGFVIVVFVFGYWLIASFFQTYIQSFWTLLYIQLNQLETEMEELVQESV